MKTSPTNVTFRRDLTLDMVQLTPGTGDFHWNVHESGKFSVGSIDSDLTQPDLPVVNNFFGKWQR
jgi:hypothetical protein